MVGELCFAGTLHRGDQLSFAPHPDGILLECDNPALPTDDTNLVVRAAKLLARAHGVQAGARIHLAKRAPLAAGVGGGSSNAAATLRGLNELWGLNLAPTQLGALAAQLGSDVTFALVGGTAIGTGRGEQVTSAMSRGTYHWVFALAERGLSTPRVYAECDRLRAGRTVSAPHVPAELMEALLAGSPDRVGAALANDLQSAAISLRPELDMLLEVGRDSGALGAMVSGSGPTVAFLVADEEAALDLAVSLSASGLCRDVVRAEGPVPGARPKDA